MATRRTWWSGDSKGVARPLVVLGKFGCALFVCALFICALCLPDMVKNRSKDMRAMTAPNATDTMSNVGESLEGALTGGGAGMGVGAGIGVV